MVRTQHYRDREKSKNSLDVQPSKLKTLLMTNCLLSFQQKFANEKLNDSTCNRYISDCCDITWGIDFYVTNIADVIFMVFKNIYYVQHLSSNVWFLVFDTRLTACN